MLLKKRLFQIFDAKHSDDYLSKSINKLLVTLILLNTLAIIFDSVPSYGLEYGILFRSFEILSVFIFTVEYIIRIWTCNVDPKYKSPVFGRLRFMTQPIIIIDLLAILPFFLPMIFPLELQVLRMLRLFRMVRLFKIGRYSDIIRKFGRVLGHKREELITTLGIVMILLVVSSSLMFYVESPVQPEVFSSIPAAMWWGVATLTTVGYGDIYPISVAGKILGAVISILGIGMVALPTGIIGAGFMEEVQRNKNQKITCPYCGKDFKKNDR